MTPEQQATLAELRELNAKRTPGEWHALWQMYDHSINGDVMAGKDGDDLRRIPIVARCSYHNPNWSWKRPLDALEGRTWIEEARAYIEPNAAFIAAAPRMMALIEALIAEITRLKGDRVEIEGMITSKGGLHESIQYVRYEAGNDKVCLDSDFTAQELRTIATHMEETQAKEQPND